MAPFITGSTLQIRTESAFLRLFTVAMRTNQLSVTLADGTIFPVVVFSEILKPDPQIATVVHGLELG